MGATLANIGENPVTGAQMFDVTAVRSTLAVMFTCGMYDYSGHWAHDVGIPAKSGVGGGIVGVVNRQLGIGTYSPRLDEKGNSVRGVAAFRSLGDELGRVAIARFTRPHQTTYDEPQVKPDPNATRASFMPGFSLPSRSSSESRIGIVAAVVLAYFWMLLGTFSSGSPS